MQSSNGRDMTFMQPSNGRDIANLRYELPYASSRDWRVSSSLVKLSSQQKIGTMTCTGERCRGWRFVAH
jgi:hypothetical protein